MVAATRERTVTWGNYTRQYRSNINNNNNNNTPNTHKRVQLVSGLPKTTVLVPRAVNPYGIATRSAGHIVMPVIRASSISSSSKPASEAGVGQEQSNNYDDVVQWHIGPMV